MASDPKPKIRRAKTRFKLSTAVNADANLSQGLTDLTNAFLELAAEVEQLRAKIESQPQPEPGNPPKP
jgi:hypothetical protein